MPADLAEYQFPVTGQTIRTLLRDGEPWFIAADVCAAIGIINVGSALMRLDEDERDSVRLADGTPGNPTKGIVNEAGLYSLILRSDKPEAKKFKRWITHEVLPSIRRTGSYAIATRVPTPAELLLQQAQQLVDHERKIELVTGQVAELGARMDGIEQRTGWMTALGFAITRSLRTDNPSVAKLGKDATRLCKARNIRPGKVHNEAFGEVGTYPIEVLEEAAGLLHGAGR